jgi:hypothetical protein
MHVRGGTFERSTDCYWLNAGFPRRACDDELRLLCLDSGHSRGEFLGA